jgi:hypothetical protein
MYVSCSKCVLSKCDYNVTLISVLQPLKDIILYTFICTRCLYLIHKVVPLDAILSATPFAHKLDDGGGM